MAQQSLVEDQWIEQGQVQKSVCEGVMEMPDVYPLHNAPAVQWMCNSCVISDINNVDYFVIYKD